MKLWSNFIYWTKDTILSPIFGEFCVELTTLLLALLFVALITLVIILIVKYRKYKSEANCNHELVVGYIKKLDDSNKNLSNEKNKCVLLEDDLRKERVNVDRLLDEIESKDNIIKSKSEQEELYIAKINELAAELLVMKEFKKRSDAARKGVRTRKKNQEKLNALIESEELTSDPTDVAIEENTNSDVVVTVEEVSEVKPKSTRKKKDKKIITEDSNSSEATNK